ncbi:MAG: type IV pilus assembly protein PilM [Candidatus Nealsonbacteria bacterium]|nr:type IV pilus assembly protein PilM [Candidatus Nealsonbacteria bacterium]
MIQIRSFISGSKSAIGVDIGTSAIKIVELSQQGKRIKLDNYGEMEATALYEKPFRSFEKSTLTISSSDVVRAITAVLKEARIKTAKAYFSIPDFSTFFTTFRLPSMTEEELPKAVQYEARQHIPLPLSEVVLDWQLIGKKSSDHKINDFDVLLVAVPNEVIRQYQDIAKFTKLEIVAMEAEVFGLARALVAPEDKSSIMLIDIGARSTTISIVDQGTVKVSHSFDTAGNDFTNLISRGLSLGIGEAEETKKKQGILTGTLAVKESILPMIDLILSEAKKISQNFYLSSNKKNQKIILAGGSAFMPGLADYFSETMEVSVEIANPFANLYYPPILEDVLRKMGPSYAIAVGAAMRGLE